MSPAYRSPHEAEVREAAVARLRELYPDARIMMEVASPNYTRMDVLAVTPAIIVAVEIKSKKDTLSRLSKQLEAQKYCAHVSIACVHRSLLLEPHAGYFALPEGPSCSLWPYPAPERGWRLDHDYNHLKPAPWLAVELLWNAEKDQLLRRHGIKVKSSWRGPDMSNALRWNLTGEQLTRGICTMLRAREVIEGDAPVPLMIEVAA